MKTDIIILAQGVQSRLPELVVPKQWCVLPACADTPLLQRTLVQLWELGGGSRAEIMQTGEQLELNNQHVTVVTWPALRYLVAYNRIYVRRSDGDTGLFQPYLHELADPGNSSLKGARAALHDLRQLWDGRTRPPAERTVILLGDVVYSWKCLELLLDSSHRDVTVCGTSDLSPSGGELWGISWHRNHERAVQGALDRALAKHPPFKEYQPGQLRRWYWEMVAQNDCATTDSMTVPLVWQTVDDYTDDVDVPEDVKNLPVVSAAAAADDLTRGITWPIS